MDKELKVLIKSLRKKAKQAHNKSKKLHAEKFLAVSHHMAGMANGMELSANLIEDLLKKRK